MKVNRFFLLCLIFAFILPIVVAQVGCQSGEDAFGFHLEQGGWYRGRQEHEMALGHYECAVGINPFSASARRGRGISFDNLGRYEEALLDFNIIVDRDPESAQAHLNFGWINYRLGENELALESYNKALQLDKDYARVYHNRAVLYQRVGEVEKSIEDYEKAIELEHDPLDWSYRGLATVYNTIGNEGEAERYFNLALEANPELTIDIIPQNLQLSTRLQELRESVVRYLPFIIFVTIIVLWGLVNLWKFLQYAHKRIRGY